MRSAESPGSGTILSRLAGSASARTSHLLTPSSATLPAVQEPHEFLAHALLPLVLMKRNNGTSLHGQEEAGGDLEAEGIAGEEVKTHDVAWQNSICHIQIYGPSRHQVPHHCRACTSLGYPVSSLGNGKLLRGHMGAD